MKAYRMTKWQAAPEFCDVDVRESGPGEVPVKVGGAGVCHSDLHIMECPDGVLPYALPFTLGHENAGWVERVGPGVSGWAAGDPVVVYSVWGCGRCATCRVCAENYCENAPLFFGGGLGHDGGMASHMKTRFCRCKMTYLGPVHDGADFFFLLSFPDTVQTHEERLENRVDFEMLEPVSAKITLGKQSGAKKSYDLAVVNYSRHGLGLLVTQKESEILEELKVGDRIREMVLYAPWAVTRVDAKVVHKTELQDGDQRGCVILGVKSRDLIANRETSKR